MLYTPSIPNACFFLFCLNRTTQRTLYEGPGTRRPCVRGMNDGTNEWVKAKGTQRWERHQPTMAPFAPGSDSGCLLQTGTRPPWGGLCCLGPCQPWPSLALPAQTHMLLRAPAPASPATAGPWSPNCSRSYACGFRKGPVLGPGPAQNIDSTNVIAKVGAWNSQKFTFSVCTKWDSRPFCFSGSQQRGQELCH